MARTQVERITCDGCGKVMEESPRLAVQITKGVQYIDLCHGCCVDELYVLLHDHAKCTDADRFRWLEERTSWRPTT